MDPENGQTQDLAYYYADWIWPTASSDQMKSMLLFFDGIALALPSSLADRVVERDPVLAQPLMDRGLLTNFEPEARLDRESANLLAGTLTELLSDNRFNEWINGEKRLITGAHWASALAPEAAATFTQELERRGLIAGGMDENELVYMDQPARLLVLTVFVKVLEACVRRSTNVRLQPVTEDDDLARQYWHTSDLYLQSISGDDRGWNSGLADENYPAVGGTARVVARDLEAVGVDLSSAPLDEVLDFRRQQGQHYRAYARSLRQFLTDSQSLTGREHKAALILREQEIADMAADLRRQGRQAFGRSSVIMALSLAGAAWTAALGDPIGAVLATATAFAGIKPQATPVTSYSYLFAAGRKLRY